MSGSQHSRSVPGRWRMRCLLILFALVACSDGSNAADFTQSPNVLFIVADDLNCAIGPYGDGVAVTPSLDRLAERGVVFLNAYCQQAVCNPSRSSFLTGLRPDHVGVDDLRKSFRETAPNGDSLVTLPEFFKRHGYFTQNIGKMFHNTGDTQDRRSWSIDEIFFHGTHAADTVYANKPFRTVKMKAPVTEALDVPDTAYRDGQIADFAATAIRKDAGSQPFFLAVGFWRPHLPFVAPKHYWDLYDPQSIPGPMPATAPTDAAPIALHDSREIRGYGSKPRDRVFSAEEIRHFRHGYYASISFLDAQVGKLLKALDGSPNADNTVIVFTSDHGFHIGEHALWGKTTNFELDARVPLIVADPRRPKGHGQTTCQIVELVDLYPTLVDVAGLPLAAERSLDGTSLKRSLDEPGHQVFDTALTQHQHPFYGSRDNWKAWGCSIRTPRWRYTEWRSIDSGSLVASELYDHESDSAETRNVVADAAHADVVSKLAERLADGFPNKLTPGHR